MEIVDYIDIAITDPEHVATAVTKFVADRGAMLTSLDVKIRISICKSPQSVRSNKTEQLQTLKQLITMNGTKVWTQDGYSFDFEKFVFKFDTVALYITAGEAVALYQKLVRKHDTTMWAAFYCNMKRKFGDNFLSEALK